MQTACTVIRNSLSRKFCVQRISFMNAERLDCLDQACFRRVDVIGDGKAMAWNLACEEALPKRVGGLAVPASMCLANAVIRRISSSGSPLRRAGGVNHGSPTKINGRVRRNCVRVFSRAASTTAGFISPSPQIREFETPDAWPESRRSSPPGCKRAAKE